MEAWLESMVQSLNGEDCLYAEIPLVRARDPILNQWGFQHIKPPANSLGVLAQLETLGENLDDWIIVYTSDHGDMMGEHGIWEKIRFYEGSVRAPLIIRWPAGFGSGRVVDANVNLCDLFATLCDLAGIPVPDGLDSRSLAPLLRGEEVPWKNETVSQFGKDHVMIKQDHLKYQYSGESLRRLCKIFVSSAQSVVILLRDLGWSHRSLRFETHSTNHSAKPGGMARCCPPSGRKTDPPERSAS